MNLLLPLFGAGIAILSVAAFWAALQNWLADVLHRAQVQLGPLAQAAQSALVVLDRVVVNGQRLYTATLRTFLLKSATHESVSVEDVRTLSRESLPADVLRKLEAGETLHYELSVGSMKVQHAPTYRLAVRRTE
jgi:hypothetical protein